ncbi:MAG: leucyl/phenylalanyl-tRNA--protein transferase [Actinomycetota bacterium]
MADVELARLQVEPRPSRFVMPDPTDAPVGHDVIAVGADLEPGTLVQAYRSGLFPMPDDPDRRSGGRIGWYSPDPRGVIPLDGLHVSRSLRRSMREVDVTFDEDFEGVVRGCADPSRPGRWITERFVEAYTELHKLGWAHSVEVRHDGELVGGLYGVRIERFFAGESMFHRRTDASKVALVATVEALRAAGAVLFDVQWTTPHLRSMGAVDIGRPEYLEILTTAIEPS